MLVLLQTLHCFLGPLQRPAVLDPIQPEQQQQQAFDWQVKRGKCMLKVTPDSVAQVTKGVVCGYWL